MTHIARSSLIIAFFFGVDKIFGFARQILVAQQFKLTYNIDVFNAANNIPDLLSALISGGALGVALIPVLSEYLETRSRRDAWQLFARILNLAFIVTGIIAFFIAIFAPFLVKNVIVPGFPPEQQSLTISLMRLDLIAIMIFSLSGLIMAGLQANQHFLLPAMAPVLYNLGQIFGLVILSPNEPLSLGRITFPAVGLGIRGLVYGVILGAALHLLIQIPGLIRYKFVWAPRLGLREAGVRQVLRLLGPRVLTMFFIQIFFIARDNLASGLGEGAVSALNYGWFIMQVPETLIGTALAIAVLPTLAEHIARKDLDSFRNTLNRTVQVLVALTIPGAFLLAAGVRPLISVLGFDEVSSNMVTLATRAYLLGLTGHALLEVASRSFYARQDAKTPLLAAAINAVLYIGLAVLFSRLWGLTGIALANSLSFTLEATLLFWLLSKAVSGIFKVRQTAIRVILGTGVGAGLVILFGTVLPFDQWSTTVETLVGIGVVGLGSLLVIPFIWQELKTLRQL